MVEAATSNPIEIKILFDIIYSFLVRAQPMDAGKSVIRFRVEATAIRVSIQRGMNLNGRQIRQAVTYLMLVLTFGPTRCWYGSCFPRAPRLHVVIAPELTRALN